MSNVITIENTEMQIREYNGQRVVTFKDIDTVHERKNGTARNNFYKNKSRFIQDEDYYIIKREDSNVAIDHIGEIPPRGLVLMTESGYLMIVKTFKDDLSWKIQRRLVNAYFKVKNEMEQTAISDDVEFSERKIPVRTATTPVPLQTNFYEIYKRKMENLAVKTGVSVSFVYHKIYEYVNETYDIKEAEKMYIKEVGRPPKFTMDLFTYFPEMGKVAGDHIQWLLDHCKVNSEA
jgi:hypothetical protein